MFVIYFSHMTLPQATPRAAAAAPAQPGRRRIELTLWQWKLCGFLLMATALSYLDRQALSVVAPVVAGEKTAMFEAAHGAAPDIAGKGAANPISLILSGALLLDHLGEREAGDRIRLAVEHVLAEARVLTPDLGGSATTRQMTYAICLACEKVAA